MGNDDVQGSGRGAGPWVLGMAGAAAVAVGLLAFGPWSDPAGEASPTASVSPTVRPQTILPDTRPAAEIPWDEVGPGWFILGFDPEQSSVSPGQDGWDLGTGETWLLSPDGVVYLGPQPPIGAEWIPYWSGTDVWFAAPDGSNCGESTCGEVIARDVLTGEERNPWGSPMLPGKVFLTATGAYLAFGGCCLGWDARLADTSGTVVDLAGGGAYWGSPSLSPDGTRVVGAEIDKTWVDDTEVEGSDAVEVWTLDGQSERFTTPPGVGPVLGWLDDHTVLLQLWESDTAVSPLGYVSLDVVGGVVASWIPPVEGADWIQPLTLGFVVSGSSWAGDQVVSGTDGGSHIPLKCLGIDCSAIVSGDRLLWFDATMGETEIVGGLAMTPIRQRLTLVDLTTGNQMILIDVAGSDGRIVEVVPHADTYE